MQNEGIPKYSRLSTTNQDEVANKAMLTYSVPPGGLDIRSIEEKSKAL